MYKVIIKQGFNEVEFEMEFLEQATGFVNAVMGYAEGHSPNTKMEIFYQEDEKNESR